MDARSWEQSQSRPSMKRPWDEDDTVLVQRSSVWNSAILPPLESTLSRRPSMPATVEAGSRTPAWSLNSRESDSKRPKFEENDYRTSVGDDSNPNTAFPDVNFNFTASLHRESVDSSSISEQQMRERGSVVGEAGPVASLDTITLCSRCKRLTTHSDDLESRVQPRHDDGFQSFLIPEMTLIAKSAATELTKAFNTLTSGIHSARSGVIHRESVELQEVEQSHFPPVAQLDLKQTLDWILRRISQVNDLADQLVQYRHSISEHPEQNSIWPGTNPQNVRQHNMRRLLDVVTDDEERPTIESGEVNSDLKPYTKRKSVLTMPNPEDLPSIRSHHDYHPFQSSVDGPSRRPSIMNPPPAPNRNLPLSPGRSLPSPTSVNLPSPSSGSYGSTAQSISLPPRGSVASSNTPYLLSITSPQSSDSALQAHTASLQHEVSVQKIALSSLQGEHDKLLAAFSRSQTRASALEKKHSVSDNEIITLSEEKIRLQNQVTDLEKDVEDLTQSRDDARQSAVQEATQYVEIIKKASHLEILASEERKAWNKLKAEMEERIETLIYKTGLTDGVTCTNDEQSTHRSRAQNADSVDIFPASAGFSLDVKPESSSPNQSRTPHLTSLSSLRTDPIEGLKAEIRILKTRCVEVEDTLRAVREESRLVEGMVRALGTAGKSILDKADKVLGVTASLE